MEALVWNKPHTLNWIANLMFALAFIMLLYASFYMLIRTPLFPLKEVRVESQLQHVTHEQVRLIVSRYLSGNFFTVNLEKTRLAFQKLPWARNVSIKRRWPSSLEVSIEEHEALARWGTVALVNTYGEMFQAASDADLPTFYGPGETVKTMAQNYAKYQQMLQDKQLKISELILSPRGSWQLATESGLVIALGREKMDERLQRFMQVYDVTAQSVGGKLTYVDLRYPSGFAVRRLGLAMNSKNVANPYAAEPRMNTKPSSKKPTPEATLKSKKG